VKALSLTEPWATLMALQEKRIETRSWDLPLSIVGQQVAIHAAKGFPKWAKQLTEEEPFCSSLLAKGNVFIPNLSCGKILCIVKFIGSRRTEDIVNQVTKKELAFGDYSAGRFAYLTEWVGKLKEPIPAVGHLGFWKCDLEFPLDIE
jgi:hypothetical protein